MTKKKVAQTITEPDRALEVSNTIELEDIALIQNKCRLLPVPQSGTEGLDYGVTATTDYSVEEENEILLVQIKLNFNAKNDSAQDIVLLSAEYIVVYSIKTKKGFPADYYIDFSDYCSVFHVWPYWREFVQRSIAEFRLPPLSLPVFKFGHKLPSEGSLVSKKQAIAEEKEAQQSLQKSMKANKKTVASKKKTKTKKED